MKKKFLSLFILAVVLLLGTRAHAATDLSISSGITDAICAGAIYANGVSTDAFCVDGLGNLNPIRNLANDIGSSQTRYKDIYAESTRLSGGTSNALIGLR